jgi:osmotically-inducible protein OsmY
VAITAQDGEVTLGGLVDRTQETADAMDVASKVTGVKNVVSRVRTVAADARHIVEG